MREPRVESGAGADSFRGCLLGLAVGDAVGTTVEFAPPGTFEPVTDMVGGGPFGLEAGQWTDDTSMALCLAASLIECGGFDPADQMRRYVRWWREGYCSPVDGPAFDIGYTVRRALGRFEATGEAFSGPEDPWSAGNGSLMRLAPVPMLFADDPARAVELSGESSRTTHGARECVDACRFFGGLLVGALGGAPKEELLAPRYEPVEGLWAVRPLAPGVDAVAAGSYRDKEPPAIRGTGYVVESLEAALWAFDRSASFEEGCLLAVNLGHDADTTGAIFGQLAGAFYGAEGIPGRWRERVWAGDEIAAIADRLRGARRR